MQVQTNLSPQEHSVTAPVQTSAISADLVLRPADDLFFSQLSAEKEAAEAPSGPTAVFRIIDGELARVMDSRPPGAVPLRPDSGIFGIVAAPGGSR
jgi:hypothetical protein